MSTYRGALVDLDGTVYRGETLLPGAEKAVKRLVDAGIPLIFLTNNSTVSRDQFAEKLVRFGLDPSVGDVLTSGSLAATFLAERDPDAVVFTVGESALENELTASGLSVTDDPDSADTVVAGMDRNLTYETLARTLCVFEGETRYIATNTDRTTPTENGERPGAGCVVGAITGMTGREPDAVTGKPSKQAAEVAVDRIGADPRDCLVIGDRLDTDIRMGIRAGMTTVLVLSGVTDRIDLERSNLQPDIVLDSIAEIDRLLT